MSLVVWLPLTKDLRQQGLSDVEAINNGATYSSTGGKLGGCYSFTTSSYQKIGFPYSLANYTEFTVCVWVKPISTTITGCLFTFVNPNDYWQFVITNGNNVGIRDNSSGETGSRKEYTLGSFVANVWTHLAISYDKGVVKIYKDGVLFSTNNTGGSAMNNYSGTNAAIGESMVSSSSYYFAGSVNDFRLYDHCLSPMEVKQISQGLVLHYPLNREGWGQENLILNSNTFATGSGASGITPSTTTDGLHQVIATSGNSNWHASWATSTATSLLENTFAEGDPFTISFTIKSENANKTNPPTIYVKSGMGYYTMQGKVGPNWSTVYYSGTWKDTNSIAFHLGFSGLVGTYLFKNWKVEKGLIATPWCPNSSDELATTMGLNEAIEYDTSGFCNNGTRTGTFSWLSNTPKYKVSTYFVDYTRKLRAPIVLTTPAAITMAVWVKSSVTGRGSYHMPLNIDGAHYEFSIGTDGKFRQGFHINGSRIVDTTNSKNLLDGQWHHLCATFDGVTIKRYVDGVAVTGGDHSASGTLATTAMLYVGDYGGSETYGNAQMYESDIRIYATALSADDVKALYENSAYIATDGAMYAYDFVES